MQNYISQNNSFPPLSASYNYVGTALPNSNIGGWPLGWAVAVLPFIEQSALYNATNQAAGISDPPNYYTVTMTKVSALQCPSESLKVGPWLSVNMANYRCNVGGPGSFLSWSGPIIPFSPAGNGTSGPAINSNGNMGSFGMEGIIDGTSNTASVQRAADRDRRLRQQFGEPHDHGRQQPLALRGLFSTSVTITLDAGRRHGRHSGPVALPGLQRHPRDPDPDRGARHLQRVLVWF